MPDTKLFRHPSASLWLDSYSRVIQPSLSQDLQTQVIVIGGGITGLTCANLLKSAGYQVVLLEADRIAGATTGHTTAKITSQHGVIYSKIETAMGTELAKQYALANETAISEIARLISEFGVDCDLLAQSAFVYTCEDSSVQKLEHECSIASQLGIQASMVDTIPFEIPIKAALRFDKQAQFHPIKYIQAMTDKTFQDGSNCTLYEHTRVVALEDSDHSPMTVVTEHGHRVTAEHVIIASHYPFLNKPAMFFARIYSERSYVLAIKAKETYPGGMYISHEEPGRSIRSYTGKDGELVLVGGSHHKTGQSEDTFVNYRKLFDFAESIMTIQNAPFHWSTQDCMTLDDIPYVGAFNKDTPNLYVATGFGKWGMTNSMASAMLIRDLIQSGTSPWQEVYNPSRKTVTASAKNFVVQNLNVAQQLVHGKIEHRSEDLLLAKDEAGIFDVEGDRTGVYRDFEGNLHFVNTTCPHLGCELQWNTAERTWDCPCHGSRFNIDGNIVEGPAVAPLQQGTDVNTIGKIIKEKF